MTLFEILSAYILENGVPFTSDDHGPFFIETAPNRIMSGEVLINYKVSFNQPKNNFHIYETSN